MFVDVFDWSLFREGTFLIRGEGVGRGILEIFYGKSRGPPTFQIGLMHGPSQIPKQKHLTLPPSPPRQKKTGSGAHITAWKERNGQLWKFCQKDETTSAPLSTRPPYSDYGKLPNFHYLSWNANLTNGHEPDDLVQPWAQIKLFFEESELVSGDSKAIRKFSDK